MTVAEVAQLIASSAAFVAAMTGLFASLRNGRRIQEVHLSTNGNLKRLEERLQEAVTVAAESKGRDDERRKPTI